MFFCASLSLFYFVSLFTLLTCLKKIKSMYNKGFFFTSRRQNMAKLYYRYGTVGSAKTLNLLAVAHNYKQQDKRVLIMKPRLDTRFGYKTVRSRAGLNMEADVLLTENTVFSFDGQSRENSGANEIFIDKDITCIVVDEAQFLSAATVSRLYELTIYCNIPVLLYGLKTDFKGHLFPGSTRILELADSVEEIKTTCFYCNKKAIFNLKLLDGKPCFKGKTVDLGADEKYRPACKFCFEKFKKAALH